MNLTISINTVTTMFLLIVAGYITRKTNIIDKTASKKLSNIIVSIAMPFLMISSLLNVEYSVENLKKGLLMILISAVIHAIAALVAFAGSRPLKDIRERQIFQYSEVFENAAFYGFPVLRAILGPIGVFYGAFYCITFNILTWTYGMFLLSRADSSIKMSPKKMFLNFGTIPALIGLALYAFRIDLPVPVISTADYLAGMSTPVSMLIIGGLLADLPAKKLFTNIKVYWLCTCKLVLLPLVCGTLAYLSPLPNDIAQFCTLIAGMPVASTAAVFAERHDIKPRYAALCVGISTLISVFTIPVITFVLSKIY